MFPDAAVSTVDVQNEEVMAGESGTGIETQSRFDVTSFSFRLLYETTYNHIILSRVKSQSMILKSFLRIRQIIVNSRTFLDQ